MMMFAMADKALGTSWAKEFFLKECINKGGLSALYKDIIDFSGHVTCSVLETLSEPDAVPAMVVCSYGKDRTGIITALVLHCMGWSEQDIVNDYAVSEGELAKGPE